MDFKYSSEGYNSEQSYKEFKSAAVVCNNEVTCTVGKNILTEGGSVVDAAIASMLTLGVVSFQSAGLGGGFYMIYYNAETNEDYFVDAKAQAPHVVDGDFYTGNEYAMTYGRSSICVPGELKGYWEAHKKFGKLPWSRIFEPAIELAENGFKITAGCETWIRVTVPKLKENKRLRSLVTRADGSFKKAGDIIVRPEYAKTLRHIVKHGADEFYNGSMTNDILKDIHDGFGFPSSISHDDFAQYKVRIEESVKMTLNDDHTLITSGAPSGGPVLAYILNILNGYHFTEEDWKKNRVLTYHRIVEAIKFAFYKRTHIEDPYFSDEVDELVNQMTCQKHAEEIKRKIDDCRTYSSEHYGEKMAQVPNDPGTAHVGVIGPDGSAVAITSTINHPFGSNVVGERTGIIFNDQINGFFFPEKSEDSLTYSKNLIGPGRRALSSTCPTIILNNSSTAATVKMILGGAGSARIINSTALTIMYHLWFGMNINESVKSRRIHHIWDPNTLEIEKGMDEETIQGLKNLGHKIEMVSGYLSTVQAISRIPGNKIAAKCDCRKGGYPDGY
uniref:glutathione hydrolase 1 proenzyme-like n=1 Tax=Styela clava TaxID=7725 RepID=UPI001939EF1F|nr:glutathione hydrolase 1 proenzyme-like [Styela clava]